MNVLSRTGRPPRCGAWDWTVLVMLCLAAMACRRPSAEPTPEELRHLADLPRLAASPDDRLRSELARLREERATPRQLLQVDPARLPDGRRPTVDTRKRSTRALTQALTDGLVKQYQSKLGTWYREVLRGIPLEERPVAATLLRDTASFRRAVKDLMERPDFGLLVELDRGPLADLRFIDRVELFVRLETIEALLRALDGQPANAVVRWDRAGAMIASLAELPHGVSRAAAARLRLEWLRAGQTIANGRPATADVLQGIDATLQWQLAHWPSDRRALVGDRAVGLITYELLRDGHWMSLLPLTELQRLKETHRLEKFAAYIGSRLDADEWYYLQTMRQIIEAAERPYFERRTLLEKIDSAQNALRDTDGYPWFAADYLLQDVDRLQRLMALDRTFTEALRWLVAGGPGDDATPPPTHLETGTLLQARVESDRIVLSNLEWPDDRVPLAVLRVAR